MSHRNALIIVTGGGTGGHLYPALSFARHMRKKIEVVYVGHPDKIEGRVVPQTEIPFVPLPAVAFTRKPMLLPGFLARFAVSLLRAIIILFRYKPNLVVGFGGYVSVPLGFAAQLLRIPIILHEQNVSPGMANRLLIKLGTPVMTTFPETAQRLPLGQAYQTSCPVRIEIGNVQKLEAKIKLDLPQNKMIFLIVGGSGGAKFLNEVILKLRRDSWDRQDWFFLHVTGPLYYDLCQTIAGDILGNAGTEARYRAVAYADEIAYYYAASDIAICRSGSATVNELLCANLPALLIPSPNVVENHQEGNARYLENIGAARVILEKDVSATTLMTALTDILDNPEKLAEMRANCQQHGLGHKALQLMEEVISKLFPDATPGV